MNYQLAADKQRLLRTAHATAIPAPARSSAIDDGSGTATKPLFCGVLLPWLKYWNVRSLFNCDWFSPAGRMSPRFDPCADAVAREEAVEADLVVPQGDEIARPVRTGPTGRVQLVAG